MSGYRRDARTSPPRRSSILPAPGSEWSPQSPDPGETAAGAARGFAGTHRPGRGRGGAREHRGSCCGGGRGESRPANMRRLGVRRRFLLANVCPVSPRVVFN